MSAPQLSARRASWVGPILLLLLGLLAAPAAARASAAPAGARASAAPAGARASAAPAVLGSVSNSGALSGVQDVAVAGNYAYTVGYWSGRLSVIDLSRPRAPRVVAATAPTNALHDADYIRVSGLYAFVASKNRNASTSSDDDGTGNALTVIDIARPTHPRVVGSVHSGRELFGAYSVAVSGRYAFVAAQGTLPGQPTAPDANTGSFTVVDLRTLRVVAHLDNAALPAHWADALAHPTSVALHGRYAYVTAFDAGHVTTIDISSPGHPVIVASLADWAHLAYVEDLAVSGGYLYAVDQTAGSADQFTIMSLANPARPAVVGALSDSALLAAAYRVQVWGSYAYVPSPATNTVTAIEVRQPSAPRVAAHVTDPSRLHAVSGVALDGGYVVGASNNRAGQHTTPYPPFPGQPGGPTVTGTIAVLSLGLG